MCVDSFVTVFIYLFIFLLCVLFFLQDESHIMPQQQLSPSLSLDRQATERLSKRSSNSLDLNANENNLSEQSGSESTEEGVRP